MVDLRRRDSFELDMDVSGEGLGVGFTAAAWRARRVLLFFG